MSASFSQLVPTTSCAQQGKGQGPQSPGRAIPLAREPDPNTQSNKLMPSQQRVTLWGGPIRMYAQPPMLFCSRGEGCLCEYSGWSRVRFGFLHTHNTFSTVATSNFPSFSRTNGSVGDQFSVRHLPQWRLPEGMSTSQGKIPVEDFCPFPSSRLFQGKLPQQEFCPSPTSNVFPGKLPTEEFYPRSVSTPRLSKGKLPQQEFCPTLMSNLSQGKIPTEEFCPMSTFGILKGKLPVEEFCPIPTPRLFQGKLPYQEFCPSSLSSLPRENPASNDAPYTGQFGGAAASGSYSSPRLSSHTHFGSTSIFPGMSAGD